MTNPFETYAETAIVSPRRARIRAQERRQEGSQSRSAPAQAALDKKQEEQAAQLRIYRAWKREIRDEIRRKYGREFKDLMRLLRNLPLSRHDELADHVEGATWLIRSDLTTRLATLSYIDSAIVRSNIRDGRPPFDDPLWDEPTTPFLRIRRVLTGV